MHIPCPFREDRPAVHEALIDACPLALLVTAGPGGPLADPLPMIRAGRVLQAHLARANPQVEQLRAAEAEGREVLAVFQGPQSYISPSWHASKRDHGRVVPTWNYLVVQVRAVPRVIDDPAWLRGQVGALTDRQERAMRAPWVVSDAPDAFVAAQLRAIVGLELPLAGVTAKWKASQNRSEADRLGVIAALAAAGNPLAAHIPAPEQPESKAGPSGGKIPCPTG